MSQFADNLNLSDLDGSNGFRIYSPAEYDYAGFSVSSAGDINGDGFLDLVIGAPDYSCAYVVFGDGGALTNLDALDGTPDGAIDLSRLDGNNGFQITTSGAPALGVSVSSAGDVNDDGFGDLLVGGADFTVLLYGNGGPFQPVYDDSDLSALAGTSAYIFLDFAGGFGVSVSTTGDINGDGIDDFVVGAPYDQYASGSAYVVFGGAANIAALDVADGFVDGFVDPTLVDGTMGFRVDGLDFPFGFSVHGAGDVDGDGRDDLIVGDYGAGQAYIVFGKDSPVKAVRNVDHMDGHNGYVLDIPLSGIGTGFSVSTAGDVNGDGFDDVIVGAPGADAGLIYNGVSVVVFGGPSLEQLDAADGSQDGTAEMVLADGTNGFAILGAESDSLSGWSVSSAGDVNGDGFADLLVGAPYGDSYAGAAYVVFGAVSIGAPAIDLATIDGNNGFKISGEFPPDYAGWSVSAAGDINGDGFGDLLVGAPYSSGGDDYAGAAYVIYGHKPDEAVIRDGTKIANTIHGSDFDDTLRGKAGGDTLIGHDGNDRILGGGGPDILNGGAGADRIDSQHGTDSFVYEQVSDSDQTAFDRVNNFDATQDSFDLWFTVTGVDTTVSARFAQIGTALDAGHLAAYHAVIVDTPGLRDYLVVDVNGAAGYQAGFDLLIALTNPMHLDQLDTGDFT